MNRRDNFWTDERVDRLRELVRGGLSNGQIATQLSGEFRKPISRCAVIGKVHRLATHRATGRGEQRQPSRRAPCAATVVKKPLAESAPTVVDPALHRSFAELGDGACKWQVGADLYCGAKAELRKPYCEGHAAEGRRPTQPRPPQQEPKRHGRFGK